MIFRILLALALILISGTVQSAQTHSIGGDQLVNAVGGSASGLTQTAAKTAQASFSGTNSTISFSQSAYVSNTAAALRFNLTDIPLTPTEDKCVITVVGTIGSLITNVSDSITWLGPWGQLNAQTNTITVKWTGGALVAWQEPMHGVVVKPQITVTVNDYDTGVADEVRVSSSNATNQITGLIGRPGGQYVILENTGSVAILLPNQNTGSATTNRFLFAQDVSLEPHQAVTLTYSATASRWKVTDMASVTEANLIMGTNTTADATINHHGLMPEGLFPLRKTLKFNFARNVDGAGCTYPNTNDFTAVNLMVPRFSDSAVSNVNYCVFGVRVPKFVSASVEMTASLSVKLTGADTAAHTYHLGMVSVANSAALVATAANFITLTLAADASGSSGDVESVNDVTLTGWAAAVTAGNWWYIELRRAGSVDASTVASDLLELEINYNTTQ